MKSSEQSAVTTSSSTFYLTDWLTGQGFASSQLDDILLMRCRAQCCGICNPTATLVGSVMLSSNGKGRGEVHEKEATASAGQATAMDRQGADGHRECCDG